MNNKAITAEEARELQQGSFKRKTPWFRLRLAFMCGVLNTKIELASEHQHCEAYIEESSRTAAAYYPMMAKLYENLGYFVRYDDNFTENKFIVCWDTSHLGDWEKHKMYEYSTPEKTQTNTAKKIKQNTRKSINKITVKENNNGKR